MPALLPSSHNHRQPIPFFLSDLSQPDIDLLTLLLSQAPTASQPSSSAHHPGNHPALRALIHTLPTHLLAPLPHQHTIVSLFPRTTNLPPCAPLCPLHRPLNAQLIRIIFTALTTELGPRLDALATHLHPSHLLLRLRPLHALWLPAPTYRARFHADHLPLWAFQPDGCEACMLARVGADKATLVALRTLLLSRRRKGRPAPRLLRWVDGWIAAVGGQEAEALRVEGEVDGRALRGVRGAARRARGGRRGDESESEGDDLENEIIEIYASFPSSSDLHVPSRAQGARRLGESPTGRARLSDGGSWRSGLQSGASSLEPRRGRDRRRVGEAERRADEYRALLGSRASSDRPGGERRSGSTSWSSFIRG